MKLPTIYPGLNGTSLPVLRDRALEVARAYRALAAALREAAPNGRDFQHDLEGGAWMHAVQESTREIVAATAGERAAMAAAGVYQVWLNEQEARRATYLAR